MTEKVPVDNKTRQVRTITAGTSLSATTILVALFFFLTSCQEINRTYPDPSRCLEGTQYVKISEGWACAPQVMP